MTDLSFLDEDARRAVETYAAGNGCTEEEALNAILKGAGSGSAANAVREHLAQHRSLGLASDNGAEGE